MNSTKFDALQRKINYALTLAQVDQSTDVSDITHAISEIQDTMTQLADWKKAMEGAGFTSTAAEQLGQFLSAQQRLLKLQSLLAEREQFVSNFTLRSQMTPTLTLSPKNISVYQSLRSKAPYTSSGYDVVFVIISVPFRIGTSTTEMISNTLRTVSAFVKETTLQLMVDNVLICQYELVEGFTNLDGLILNRIPLVFDVEKQSVLSTVCTLDGKISQAWVPLEDVQVLSNPRITFPTSIILRRSLIKATWRYFEQIAIRGPLSQITNVVLSNLQQIQNANRDALTHSSTLGLLATMSQLVDSVPISKQWQIKVNPFEIDWTKSIISIESSELQSNGIDLDVMYMPTHVISSTGTGGSFRGSLYPKYSQTVIKVQSGLHYELSDTQYNIFYLGNQVPHQQPISWEMVDGTETSTLTGTLYSRVVVSGQEMRQLLTMSADAVLNCAEADVTNYPCQISLPGCSLITNLRAWLHYPNALIPRDLSLKIANATAHTITSFSGATLDLTKTKSQVKLIMNTPKVLSGGSEVITVMVGKVSITLALTNYVENGVTGLRYESRWTDIDAHETHVLPIIKHNWVWTYEPFDWTDNYANLSWWPIQSGKPNVRLPILLSKSAWGFEDSKQFPTVTGWLASDSILLNQNLSLYPRFWPLTIQSSMDEELYGFSNVMREAMTPRIPTKLNSGEVHYNGVQYSGSVVASTLLDPITEENTYLSKTTYTRSTSMNLIAYRDDGIGGLGQQAAFENATVAIALNAPKQASVKGSMSDHDTITVLGLPDKIFNSAVLSDLKPNVVYHITSLYNQVAKLKYAIATIEGTLQSIVDNLNLLWSTVSQLSDAIVSLAQSVQDIQHYLQAQSSSGLGIFGTLLSTIGEMLGSFLPLVGVTCAIVGLVLSGIDSFSNGDWLSGLLNMTLIAGFTAYGFKKLQKRWNQKMNVNAVDMNNALTDVPVELRDMVDRQGNLRPNVIADMDLFGYGSTPPHYWDTFTETNRRASYNVGNLSVENWWIHDNFDVKWLQLYGFTGPSQSSAREEASDHYIKVYFSQAIQKKDGKVKIGDWKIDSIDAWEITSEGMKKMADKDVDTEYAYFALRMLIAGSRSLGPIEPTLFQAMTDVSPEILQSLHSMRTTRLTKRSLCFRSSQPANQGEASPEAYVAARTKANATVKLLQQLGGDGTLASRPTTEIEMRFPLLSAFDEVLPG